jgi:hypothetical protein
LTSTNPSIAFFIPVLSVALELLAAGALVILIRGLTRQAEFTAGLQKASHHQSQIIARSPKAGPSRPCP